MGNIYSVFPQHERQLGGDSGSEGWGFESLLACQKSCCPLGGRIFVFVSEGTRTLRGGAAKQGHAGGMSAPRGPQQLCCKDGSCVPSGVPRKKARFVFRTKRAFLRTKGSALRNVKVVSLAAKRQTKTLPDVIDKPGEGMVS